MDTKLSPREAKTNTQLCSLKMDNLSYKHFWFLVQEKTVTLAKQTTGEQLEHIVEIPKSLFNKMVDWYNAKQE